MGAGLECTKVLQMMKYKHIVLQIEQINLHYNVTSITFFTITLGGKCAIIDIRGVHGSS